jgi:dephospho-CoA kinase
MIKVALTGGIGSGKSYIANKFNILYNIPIFDCDHIAKEQYKKEEVKEKLIKQFGNDIYINNNINREFLGNIVFNKDNIQKDILISILHDYIFKEYDNFLKINKDKKYTILESAIIFENNLTKYFDKIISVICDRKTRIERIIERNNLSVNEIEKRMNLQHFDSFLIKNSNFVILNNLKLDDQILKIHNEIINIKAS